MKVDPLNGVILPLIGAGIFFALWYWGVLSWDVIKYILTEGI